ncbi:MAG: IPT/TIG domain-containing protein [Cyanobacteria bacterium REEB65]|nr:IPT/TIG domain-containing protein [Cyanobacteria bacterium REEB65]
MPGLNRLLVALLATVSLLLASCHVPLSTPLGSDGRLNESVGSAATTAVPPIRGQVTFASTRTVQATMNDVALKATVSLIDTSLDQTIASGVTNSTGAFTINLQSGWAPDPNATYYLEAVKGLGNNEPGSNAARVRTLIRFQAGTWTSITGGTITLDPSTTALSIGAALRNGNPGPFDFSSLIGSVVVGNPDTYKPVTGLPASDYTALLALVNQLLGANADPVAGIALDVSAGTWNLTNQTLALDTLTPTSGSVGATITATGVGFSTRPADDTVRFNGIAATPGTATGTTMTLVIPPGATSGQTTVQVGNLVALGPLFSVSVVLTAMSPASGSAATSVTLTGSGFDTTALTNNTVTFAGVAGQVTAVTPTSLAVSVPTAAISGPLVVTVDGSTTTASSSFTVPVVVSSFTPTVGGNGTSVTISGSGFSAIAASDSVTFNGVAAAVTSASPTSLTVTAPNSANGPIAVMVAGQTGTSAALFAYTPPALDALYQPITNGGTLNLEGIFSNSAVVNFPGGAAVSATMLGANRATVAVPAGATSGNLTVTTGGLTTGAMPFRNTSFGMGLGPFNAYYDQTTTPRAMPSLVTARYLASSAVVGNSVYVIGGYTAINANPVASIERATLNADGTLGSFNTVSSALTTPRWGEASVIIGNYLYVLGGDNDVTKLSSIERAPINADGSLGSFATVSATLAQPLTYFTCEIIGSYLYAFGGTNYYGSWLTDVERAPINADGSIGSFTSGVATMSQYRVGACSVVIGNYVYVLGGGLSGNGALNTIDAAPIHSDGTLGAFAAISPTMVDDRAYFSAAVVGNYLYALGGNTGTGAWSTIERAPINSDGTLGTFALVGNLTTARASLESAVIGNYLYVIGGHDPSNNLLTSVERASIDGTGNIGGFAVYANPLVAGRTDFQVVPTPTYLYAIGGLNPTSGVVATIERAPIYPDGSLGAFTTVSGLSLVTPRYLFSTAVIGSTLYVVGGTSSSGDLQTVEQATIYSDGTLGAFSTDSGVTLVNPTSGHSSAVIGGYLYILGGGAASSGAYYNAIERAPINASGTLGAFSTYSGSLTAARFGVSSAVIGNYVYAFGGWNGAAAQNTIERAVINPDGSLGSFASVAGVTLQSGLVYSSTAIIGNSLFVLGGTNGANLTEQAPINSDGTIGTFSLDGGGSALMGQSRVVLGNYLYELGGMQCACGNAITEVGQAQLQ